VPAHVTSSALAAMLKATNSGPKHYKLIWRDLYFITLNKHIVVILWWILLTFSGRTKRKVDYSFYYNKSLFNNAKIVILNALLLPTVCAILGIYMHYVNIFSECSLA
jgi:hypothetical protein